MSQANPDRAEVAEHAEAEAGANPVRVPVVVPEAFTEEWLDRIDAMLKPTGARVKRFGSIDEDLSVFTTIAICLEPLDRNQRGGAEELLFAIKETKAPSPERTQVEGREVQS